MRFATHRPRLRRALSFSALAVVLAFTSISLTQCRMVADRITGVQPLTNQTNRCIERCRDIYRISIIIENAINRIKIQLCHGNSACLAAEAARHQAALATIEARRTACIQNCHSQGGGDN